MNAISYVLFSMYVYFLYITFFYLLIYLDKRNEIKIKKWEDCKYIPSVSIAIPAYNEEKTIRKTLESVISLDYPKNLLDIIVINDGSKDNTQKIVETIIEENLDTKIRLINKQNGGKGAALNAAIDASKSEIFICLDADSCISKTALKKMIPYFDEEKVAVVLPLMKVEKPKSVLQRIQWCEYLLNFFYKSILGRIDAIHVSPGPFSAYKRDVLVKVGKFEENILTEDMEITMRLQKYHYKIIQIADAEVYTVAPKTLPSFYKQRNRWYKGTIFNVLKYKGLIFNKNYGDFGMWQLPQILLSGFLAVMLVILSSYQFIIKPLLKYAQKIGLMNYDIPYLFQKWSNNFLWVDVNPSHLFFAILSICIALFIIRNAYKKTGEKLINNGITTIPLYVFTYGIIISSMWIGVFFDLIRGKKQKW